MSSGPETETEIGLNSNFLVGADNDLSPNSGKKLRDNDGMEESWGGWFKNICSSWRGVKDRGWAKNSEVEGKRGNCIGKRFSEMGVGSIYIADMKVGRGNYVTEKFPKDKIRSASTADEDGAGEEDGTWGRMGAPIEISPSGLI